VEILKILALIPPRLIFTVYATQRQTKLSSTIYATIRETMHDESGRLDRAACGQ
ncbi:hypothetical protein K0M31_013142, partial [Melipona bicolor]